MKNSKQVNVYKTFTQSLLIGSIIVVSSQPVLAMPLGLTDVYQMALNHDAKLAQAQSQYQADIQGLDTARATLLPQIKADGSYFVTDSSNDASDVNTQSFSVTLDQSLYRHENWAQYDKSKYLVESAEAKLQESKQDLIIRVTEAYFDVLLAQETLRLATTKEAADATQFETAEASVELGLLSRVDVLQAKSSYDLSKSDTIKAENSLDVALEALSKLTGQLPAKFENSRLKKLLPNVALPGQNLSLSTLEERATVENLLVKQAQTKLSIANQEIDVQRGGYWPTVDLQAKYTDTAYSDFQAGSTSFNDSNNTSIGVRVSMPLYSGGSTRSKVAAAKYVSMASQQALREAQENARLDIRTQKLNLDRGHKLVAALREAVKSNDAFLESAEEGYKVGLKSLLEVLTARTNQNTAQKNLIEAIHNQVLNKLRLEAALGDLTIEDIQKYEPLLQTANK